MRRHRLLYAACLLVVGLLTACGSLMPSPDSAPGPVFLPTAQDVLRIASLADRLDAKARQCVQAADCEQVYFGTALVNLFQNREAAAASFRLVIEHNPAGPLADSSRRWLRLIEKEQGADSQAAVQAGPWTDIVAQYVREWMDRQLTEQGHDAPTTTTTVAQEPAAVREPPVDQLRIIQGMQKQLRVRERQMAALRSQLDALKLIDQDNTKNQRKVRPPASLRAPEHDAGR
jgi:hypothetical protein